MGHMGSESSKMYDVQLKIIHRCHQCRIDDTTTTVVDIRMQKSPVFRGNKRRDNFH